MNWVKAILAAAAFVYPALWTAFTLSGRARFIGPMPFRRNFGAYLAATFGALAILFLWRSQLARWRTIAAGLALSGVIYGGASWTARAAQERRQARTAELLATLPKPAPGQPYQRIFFQRGVSFTAEAGVGYGSDAAIAQLGKLAAFGVDSVSLIPYGGGRATASSIEIRTAGRGSWESDAGIEISAAAAHRLGMKVMLKPHLWRLGPEAAGTEELRRQWFAQYAPFIEHYARLAARIHADILVVGTEFGTLSHREREWREIIARVRAIYPGPLTFAPTQGPEFEDIAFWDALDYIGLDSYYPLGDGHSTANLMSKVEAVQRKFNKPVLFTEAGFSAVENARLAPWEDETSKPLSLEEQRRCYEALFAALYEKPWFHGFYWWKLGTNGYGGPDNNSMTPWGKPAMELVKRWYTSGKR